MSQKLSWQILVNFGRARINENLAKMGQDGAKLELRWRQDPPSWGQDGHLEAIWGVILSIFGGLGGLWLEALGEYFGRSWPQVGLSSAILASSWELLGDMLGLRWPKMANLSRKSE